MPELEMAAPGDVSRGENGHSSSKIENDSEIAAVVAIDQHSADEGNQQAGRGRYDDLVADLDG